MQNGLQTDMEVPKYSDMEVSTIFYNFKALVQRQEYKKFIPQ